MYLGPRLRDTLARIEAASSLAALRNEFVRAARRMGFENVVLIQHGGLT